MPSEALTRWFRPAGIDVLKPAFRQSKGNDLVSSISDQSLDSLKMDATSLDVYITLAYLRLVELTLEMNDRPFRKSPAVAARCGDGFRARILSERA